MTFSKLCSIIKEAKESVLQKWGETEESMLEKVSKLLAEQLNVSVDAVTPEKEIVKDLGADSLDIVELMMALEDEYGVTLPDDEVVDVKTVQDIVDMLAKIEK